MMVTISSGVAQRKRCCISVGSIGIEESTRTDRRAGRPSIRSIVASTFQIVAPVWWSVSRMSTTTGRSTVVPFGDSHG